MRSILETAKVNDIFAVRYGDDNCEHERIGRVIGKRDTETNPVKVDTRRRRPDILRSRFLITCQLQGGEVRSFYAGSEFSSRRVGRLKASWMALRGKLPRRVVAS